MEDTVMQRYAFRIIAVGLLMGALAHLSLLFKGKVDQHASWVKANNPAVVTTSVYLGKNLSYDATSITGSTIHMEYQDFIKRSHYATETFWVKENEISSFQNKTDAYMIYAVVENQIYTTRPEIKPPGIHGESFFDTYVQTNFKIKDDILVIDWRLEPWRLTIGVYIGLVMALAIVLWLIACPIFTLIMTSIKWLITVITRKPKLKNT